MSSALIWIYCNYVIFNCICSRLFPSSGSASQARPSCQDTGTRSRPSRFRDLRRKTPPTSSCDFSHHQTPLIRSERHARSDIADSGNIGNLKSTCISNNCEGGGTNKHIIIKLRRPDWLATRFNFHFVEGCTSFTFIWCHDQRITEMDHEKAKWRKFYFRISWGIEKEREKRGGGNMEPALNFISFVNIYT